MEFALTDLGDIHFNLSRCALQVFDRREKVAVGRESVVAGSDGDIAIRAAGNPARFPAVDSLAAVSCHADRQNFFP